MSTFLLKRHQFKSLFVNIFRLHNEPWVLTYSWQPEPRKKTHTHTHTIISALHQLVLKRNLGIFKLASADANWILLDGTLVVECLKASDFFGSSFCENSHVPWHPYKTSLHLLQVSVTSFVCSFFKWCVLISSRRYENVRHFSTFRTISFVRVWLSLLERVDGIKLFTDSSYDYLFSKRNLIFLSNISIHITWHHWQKFFF